MAGPTSDFGAEHFASDSPPSLRGSADEPEFDFGRGGGGTNGYTQEVPASPARLGSIGAEPTEFGNVGGGGEFYASLVPSPATNAQAASMPSALEQVAGGLGDATAGDEGGFYSSVPPITTGV